MHVNLIIDHVTTNVDHVTMHGDYTTHACGSCNHGRLLSLPNKIYLHEHYYLIQSTAQSDNLCFSYLGIIIQFQIFMKELTRAI